MSQTLAVPAALVTKELPEKWHRMLHWWAWVASTAFVLAFASYGADYYTLGTLDRPFSPKHALLRPSGPVGVRLGMFSVLLFFLIYLYPLRKRWGWLGRKGNSRHWLDFHIVMGTTAPLIVALHSSFKFGGIAGMAFWLMTMVTLSGFIGRYLYAQVPRSLSAAEISMREMRELEVSLRRELADRRQGLSVGLESIYELPSVQQVAKTPMLGALVWMIWIDVFKPFQVSMLRLKAAGFAEWLKSVGGLFPTKDRRLEQAIQVAKKQAALSKHMLFLDRTKQVFGLWHVIHRPFSYSFAMLAIIHIAVVLAMGYRW
jgi:TRAP-type C4-dicarboxylate transport system permease small subunit